MKKFTKLLICLMLCVVSFGLVACDNRTQKEKNFTYPSGADVVTSNGGLAVQKGNYVYFVNGYKSVSSITSKKTVYTVGSLMLMKLGENGEVVTDENGLLKDEYFITMSTALCGYEATNLYIHGEYLYFVSPCLENESGDKVWAKERVIFNRIKLNKSGKVETVYETGVKFDQLQYEFYETNGSLNILVWEKGDSYYNSNGYNTLVKVNASSKTSVKIANNVSSVVFAENSNEIFFVKDDSENSRYDLKQYNIASNEVSDYSSESKTFTAKFVANGKIYITKAHNYGSSTDILVSNIAGKSGFEFVYAYEGTPELDITDDGAALVLINGNVITLIGGENNIKTITDAEEVTAIKVIGYYNGSIVYYDTTSENSNIKMVSYHNLLNGDEGEISTLATLEKIGDDCAYFDLSSDNAYMYFYQMEGNNYYLNRLKVNNNLGETEEMFGVYLSEDAPEIEEETEETEEE